MKKKSGNLSYIVLGCGVLLSALVLIFMTLTGIKGNLIGTEVSVYGMLSYGDETRIGLVLALIFVIAALAAAGVVLVFKLMNMKCGFDGWLALIGAVLSLVAGILFFCGISLIGLGDTGIYSLGIGSVLCGILAIVNAFVLGYYAVITLKK